MCVCEKERERRESREGGECAAREEREESPRPFATTSNVLDEIKASMHRRVTRHVRRDASPTIQLTAALAAVQSGARDVE